MSMRIPGVPSPGALIWIGKDRRPRSPICWGTLKKRRPFDMRLFSKLGINHVPLQSEKNFKSFEKISQKIKAMKSDSKFKDPVKIKKQRPEDKPKDGKNSPWDFRCPQYDQRSSTYVNAGTHYGTAINQPVGHEGNPKQRVEVLPFGRPSTMEVDEVG